MYKIKRLERHVSSAMRLAMMGVSMAGFSYQPATRADDKMLYDKADVQEGLNLSSIWPRHWVTVTIVNGISLPLTLPCFQHIGAVFHASRT